MTFPGKNGKITAHPLSSPKNIQRVLVENLTRTSEIIASYESQLIGELAQSEREASKHLVFAQK